MQSAAATMGEISHPVAVSTARGAVATGDAVNSVEAVGRVSTLEPLALRHFARACGI
jgi:hypothetical protein